MSATTSPAVDVVDAVPLQSGDGRGLAVFYAVTGWIVGGHLLASLLPPLWATIGPLLPNGAGVDALRRTVYLQGHAVAAPLLLIAGRAVAGAVVTLVGVRLRSRRAPVAP